jgi:hypothetical protein
MAFGLPGEELRFSELSMQNAIIGPIISAISSSPSGEKSF